MESLFEITIVKVLIWGLAITGLFVRTLIGAVIFHYTKDELRSNREEKRLNAELKMEEN